MELLYILSFLDLIYSHLTYGSELCLCRKCGHEIATAGDIIAVESSSAIKKYKNLTLFDKLNVTVQLFRNPAGQKFQVVSFKKADTYKPHDKYFSEATWFPRFSWTQVVCPSCGVHLGWHFRSESSSNMENFYGLIVTSLSSDTYVKNLTLVPKPRNAIQMEEL